MGLSKMYVYVYNLYVCRKKRFFFGCLRVGMGDGRVIILQKENLLN